MSYKALSKIDLRNKGIEVLPSCYTPRGVILSFCLPKKTMKKVKELRKGYKNKGLLLVKILDNFKFTKVPLEESIYSEEFEEYLEDNEIELGKKLRHKDYLYNSAIIPTHKYERIKEIANYYRISRSSLVRVMIDCYYSKVKGK